MLFFLFLHQNVQIVHSASDEYSIMSKPIFLEQ